MGERTTEYPRRAPDPTVDRDPFALPGDAPDPFARTGAARDPFAPTGAPPEVTPTLMGPLARRDPRARADESAEFRVAGESSFDDLLHRARKQGFLAGGAAGLLAAAVVAAGALALSGRAPSQADPPAQAAPYWQTTDAPFAPRDPGVPPATIDARSAPAPAPARRGEAKPSARGDSPIPPDRMGLSLREERTAAPSSAADPRAPAPPPSARPDARAGEAPSLAPAVSDAAAGREAPALPPDSTDAAAGEAPSLAPAASPAGARAIVGAREVAAAMRERQDAVEGCAAATLTDEEAARGLELRLAVVIEPTGRVSAARVDNPAVERTPLGVCIGRLARAMSFAPFEGERVEVEVPVRVGGP